MSVTIVNVPTTMNFVPNSSDRFYSNDIIDQLVSIIIANSDGRIEQFASFQTGSGITLIQNRDLGFKGLIGTNSSFHIRVSSSTNGFIIFAIFRGGNAFSSINIDCKIDQETKLSFLRLPHCLEIAQFSFANNIRRLCVGVYNLDNNRVCVSGANSSTALIDSTFSGHVSGIFGAVILTIWARSTAGGGPTGGTLNGRRPFSPVYLTNSISSVITPRIIFDGFPLKLFCTVQPLPMNGHERFVVGSTVFYKTSIEGRDEMCIME